MIRSLRPARAGLTLIELLVVIAITGVLVSLSLASVQKVRTVVSTAEKISWRQQHKLGSVERRSQPINVLFVGNSFTYYWQMPKMLEELARSANVQPPLKTQQYAQGSSSLQMLWNMPECQSNVKDPNQDWDFIVLQEMRGLPVNRTGPDGLGFKFGRGEFYVPYAKKFHDLIQARKANTMLYMTWKTPAVSRGLTQDDWTDSHIRLAKELRCEVSPVGMAIERVISLRPNLNIFTDQYPGHPNQTGMYLVACTFFASIYDQSPIGLPSNFSYGDGLSLCLSQSDAEFLQSCAWLAYQDCKKRMK